VRIEDQKYLAEGAESLDTGGLPGARELSAEGEGFYRRLAKKPGS
jgi:hypothetical protein